MMKLLNFSLGKSAMKALATCLFFTLVACDKQNTEPETPPTQTGAFTIEIKRSAKAKEEATYFSFETNQQLEIDNADATTSLDWDIAIIGLSARTNGGVSGSGKGCAIRTETEDFEHLTSAAPYIEQENLWETDKKKTVYTFDGNMPPSKVTLGINPLLCDGKWYSMKPSSTPIEAAVDHNVYILRTAKGRYVKLQLIALSGESGQLGNIRFRYDFIKETGSNQLAAPKLRDNEKLISGDGTLEQLLPEIEAKSVVYLTVQNKTLSQTDLDYIKTKMPALEELDLRHATLSVYDGQKGFQDFKNIRKLVMPINLEAVGFGHLSYTNLEEVIFPGNKLLRIGSGAFSFSEKIKELKLPDSVEAIGKEAFSVMKGLEHLEFPASVSIISESSCYYCPNLKSVVFKGKIRTLENYAFSYCKSLTSLKFMNATPPTFNEGTWPLVEAEYWDNADKAPRVFIYVPKGSVDAYLSAWRFKKADAAYFKEF
ncbi:leucine-rich repeat protein [Bacteroides heparinolyticus]|uniref:leucine-rich repeat protein n=1 Tax=Prevotella heparinolytica TaxID=28113 RepID=UPI0035A1A51E